ncbi:MAG: DNA-processing protein DprA [Burkholderiaceae bacterium]|jgi:DNA processing protein|nr:DNA-processing protein DprA [Burkholderiaceae bacterium]
MEHEALTAWLRLALTPGVGNDAARRLLAAFGLPQAIFSQSTRALEQVVSSAQARALRQTPDRLAQTAETTARWLEGGDAQSSGGMQRRLVTLGDALYPPALLCMEDPPVMLYALGQLGAGVLDGAAALAMVGSRNPTPQGAINARQFARAFVDAGLTVVSGLALGIDAAAHEGALQAAEEGTGSARPATVAVVGTGLDRVYPSRNRALAHRIAQNGVIFSEYHLGTPPLAANFPKRNRLIAGLSQGALVVEAALQSGSLITARLAAEQGKEVFAIPGSIHSVQSRGCHGLIKQGAKLVESARDVLEELRVPMAAAQAPAAAALPGAALVAAASPEDTPLLQALGADPVSLDALQARTGLDTAQLQAQLLEMELQGHVARLPGGLFQRLSSA